MTGNVALTQCVLSTVPLRVENRYLLGASLTELRDYFFRTSSAKHRRIELIRNVLVANPSRSASFRIVGRSLSNLDVES